MTAGRVGHYDWLNRSLFEAIPARAKRILDVGCNTGLLGEALKQADPSRHVVGIEQDADAGEVAAGRLDDVHVIDVENEDLSGF